MAFFLSKKYAKIEKKMEIIIKIKNYIFFILQPFWERTATLYWPQYYGWLTQKLAIYDPFMVLTAATSFALFFFLLFYWVRNR